MGDISSLTFTKITDSEFGNKRIWIGTMTVGDGSSTWPADGIELTPSDFVMDSIDDVLIDGGTLVYGFDGTSIDAYTCDGTPGATKVLVEAEASVPNESVRIMVIGNGGGS